MTPGTVACQAGSVPRDAPGKNTGVGSLSLLQVIFPGIEPRSPTLQADSLPSELQESLCSAAIEAIVMRSLHTSTRG